MTAMKNEGKSCVVGVSADSIMKEKRITKGDHMQKGGSRSMQQDREIKEKIREYVQQVSTMDEGDELQQELAMEQYEIMTAKNDQKNMTSKQGGTSMTANEVSMTEKYESGAESATRKRDLQGSMTAKQSGNCMTGRVVQQGVREVKLEERAEQQNTMTNEGPKQEGELRVAATIEDQERKG